MLSVEEMTHNDGGLRNFKFFVAKGPIEDADDECGMRTLEYVYHIRLLY
jgi:hypothetical protein